MAEQHRAPEPSPTPPPLGRRPWQVIAAIPLLLPAVLSIGVAGIGVLRLNADDGIGSLICFGVPVAAMLVAGSGYSLAGLVGTWRGRRPGGGTYLPTILLVAGVIGLGLAAVISHRAGRRTGGTNPMHWEPTMAVPMILAALSLAGQVLLASPAVRRWFRPALLARPELDRASGQHAPDPRRRPSEPQDG